MDAPDVNEPTGDPARPTCRCGFDRDHPMVSPIKTFNWAGKFWVFFFGVSYDPIHIAFKCRICGDVFDETDDPAEIPKYY